MYFTPIINKLTKHLNYQIQLTVTEAAQMTLPLDILQNSLNSQISVLLKDGRTLEGKLIGYDEYMNMVLEDTGETTIENSRKLGTIVLRGNNIIRIAPKYKSK